MKTELIQTEDYILFINLDDKERHGWCVHLTGQVYYMYGGGAWSHKRWHKDSRLITGFDFKDIVLKKIIGYYPLTKEAKELEGIPVLPNPFRGSEYIAWDRAEKIFFEKIGRKPILEKDNDLLIMSSLQEGVMDSLSSKQFSLEQLNKAIDMAWGFSKSHSSYNYANVKGNDINIPEDRRKDILRVVNLIPTQQLPKEFIPEYKKRFNKYDKDVASFYGEGFISESNELKTITNSEGKQELVGTYKY